MGAVLFALAIAKEALLERENQLKAVETWTGEIIASPACPDWLKQGGLNELYYSVFGSFWENGCITKTKKFGNLPEQHLEFLMESLEYRDAEALDVSHHYCRTNRDLWPRIERDILLVFADFIMDTPDGGAPHNIGSPDLDTGRPCDVAGLDVSTREGDLGAADGGQRSVYESGCEGCGQHSR